MQDSLRSGNCRRTQHNLQPTVCYRASTLALKAAWHGSWWWSSPETPEKACRSAPIDLLFAKRGKQPTQANRSSAQNIIDLLEGTAQRTITIRFASPGPASRLASVLTVAVHSLSYRAVQSIEQGWKDVLEPPRGLPISGSSPGLCVACNNRIPLWCGSTAVPGHSLLVAGDYCIFTASAIAIAGTDYGPPS